MSECRSLTSAKCALRVFSEMSEKAAPVSSSICRGRPAIFKFTMIGLADSDPNLSMKYSVSLSVLVLSEASATYFVFPLVCRFSGLWPLDFVRHAGAMCPFLPQK